MLKANKLIDFVFNYGDRLLSLAIMVVITIINNVPPDSIR
jgi:hypothetical protein